MLKYVLFCLIILLWIVPVLVEPESHILKRLHFIGGCLIQVPLSSIILISRALSKKYKVILFLTVIVVNVSFLFNYILTIVKG